MFYGFRKDEGEIDFVLTWVDGSDPAWQKERERFAPKENEDGRRSATGTWGSSSIGSGEWRDSPPGSDASISSPAARLRNGSIQMPQG